MVGRSPKNSARCLASKIVFASKRYRIFFLRLATADGVSPVRRATSLQVADNDIFENFGAHRDFGTRIPSLDVAVSATAAAIFASHHRIQPFAAARTESETINDVRRTGKRGVGLPFFGSPRAQSCNLLVDGFIPTTLFKILRLHELRWRIGPLNFDKPGVERVFQSFDDCARTPFTIVGRRDVPLTATSQTSLKNAREEEEPLIGSKQKCVLFWSPSNSCPKTADSGPLWGEKQVSLPSPSLFRRQKRPKVTPAVSVTRFSGAFLLG